MGWPRTPRVFSTRRRGDRVASGNCTGTDDLGAPAAMAPHGRIASVTEGCLHARARGARDSQAKRDLTDLQRLVPPVGEVEAGDNEIAAECRRIDPVMSGQSGDDRQVFGLDERDSALSRAAMIAIEARARDIGDVDRGDLGQACCAETDPVEATGLRASGDELGQRDQVGSSSTITRSRVAAPLA